MDKKNKKENRIKKLGMNVKNWFTGNLKASTKQTVALLIILLVAISFIYCYKLMNLKFFILLIMYLVNI